MSKPTVLAVAWRLAPSIKSAILFPPLGISRAPLHRWRHLTIQNETAVALTLSTLTVTFLNSGVIRYDRVRRFSWLTGWCCHRGALFLGAGRFNHDTPMPVLNWQGRRHFAFGE